MNTSARSAINFPALVRAIMLSLGLIVLGASWAFQVIYLYVCTPLLLAPWADVCCSVGRPPLGTWYLSVNDFFADPPGTYLPVLVFIAPSVLIFLFRARRAKNLVNLLCLLLISNLLYLLIAPVVVLFSFAIIDLARQAFSLPDPPDWYGGTSYTTSLPAIFAVFGGAIAVLIVQATAATGSTPTTPAAPETRELQTSG